MGSMDAAPPQSFVFAALRQNALPVGSKPIGGPTRRSVMKVALLTGGADRPYAFGLATALIDKQAELDLIGSDELDGPEFRGKPGVAFLNLRGDQRPDASFFTKVLRVLLYYARLIAYGATAKPKIFHILWN